MAAAIAAVQTPGRRRRSEGKKAAILDAAEALFIAEGYERASVDAIAARAQVSKRTVYDHFGDKRTIFLRALERVNDALVSTVRTAIEEELAPDRDLREALTAFARRVVTQAVPSSDYVTFRRLTAQRWSVPRLADDARDRPERMLEERFALLAAADGGLRAPDPALAARHFIALTVGLALDALDDRQADPNPASASDPASASEAGQAPEGQISAIIADGVDAFLRAYR